MGFKLVDKPQNIWTYLPDVKWEDETKLAYTLDGKIYRDYEIDA